MAATMKEPPPKIDNAKVCRYAIIDAACRHTDKCRHFVAGQLMEPAAGLAICQYADGPGFYLLYCDDAWDVVTDTWHESMERAMGQAEFEYEGIGRSWKDA